MTLHHGLEIQLRKSEGAVGGAVRSWQQPQHAEAAMERGGGRDGDYLEQGH